MSHTRKTIQVYLALTLYSSVALASDATYWKHNGAAMAMTFLDGDADISYLLPRPGMLDVGVTRGTDLAQLKNEGNKFSGREFFFTNRCGRLEFGVSGYGVIRDTGNAVITLVGLAPTLDEQCHVIGYKNHTSTFERLNGEDDAEMRRFDNH